MGKVGEIAGNLGIVVVRTSTGNSEWQGIPACDRESV